MFQIKLYEADMINCLNTTETCNNKKENIHKSTLKAMFHNASPSEKRGKGIAYHLQQF